MQPESLLENGNKETGRGSVLQFTDKGKTDADNKMNHAFQKGQSENMLKDETIWNDLDLLHKMG